MTTIIIRALQTIMSTAVIICGSFHQKITSDSFSSLVTKAKIMGKWLKVPKWECVKLTDLSLEVLWAWCREPPLCWLAAPFRRDLAERESGLKLLKKQHSKSHNPTGKCVFDFMLLTNNISPLQKRLWTLFTSLWFHFYLILKYFDLCNLVYMMRDV